MNQFTPFGPNHYVRNVQSDINNICQPLFDKLDLNYFHYFKAYKNGTAVILYNRMDWSDHFYRNDFRTVIPLPKQEIKLDKYTLCLWRGVVQDHVVSDARNLCNLDHPLAICIVHPDHFESFAFGTRQGNDGILNTYFNNVDVLLQFTHAFKQQAFSVIKKAEENKITLPTEFRPEAIKLLDSLDSELTLTGNNGQARLSLKEMEILRMITYGKTSKEIASQLERSPRTVETHITHLKNKLHCDRKSELIKLAIENNIGVM